MPSPLLERIRLALPESYRGLKTIEDSLQGKMACRYGRFLLHVSHDAEAEQIRVSVRVPPPAGAGKGFLIWCLSTNNQYWNVKFALDEDGMLLVHADLESDREAVTLAESIVEYSALITRMLEEDLLSYVQQHDLMTPEQANRWKSPEPG